MTIADIALHMIHLSRGNRQDIQHFLKVYAYAKTIGELEGLDPDAQWGLEAAALLHDMGRPLCKEKYGSTAGPLQEREGAILAEVFLKEGGVPEAQAQRVVFLVGHHHSPAGADGLDYQILLEADYLVNAAEKNLTQENLRAALEDLFRTPTGIALLKSVFSLQ